MLALSTMLTMIMYWMLFGISVGTFLFLMYGIAYILGELPEWLKERFAKPSLRKRRIGSNPILSAKE